MPRRGVRGFGLGGGSRGFRVVGSVGVGIGVGCNVGGRSIGSVNVGVVRDTNE